MKSGIRLSAGDWEALVLPDFGMNTVALTYRGTPVLHSPESRAQLEEKATIYGTPPLLPPNRTAFGRFCFDGTEYQMPINETDRNNFIHGWMHKSPFTVLSRTDCSLTAQLDNTGDLFAFPFRLTATCTLSERGCEQTYTFQNTGVTDMPLVFALHTSFVQPDRVRIPLGQNWVVNENLIPTGELCSPNALAQSVIEGMDPRGRTVSGFYTAAGHTAEIGDFGYTASDNFDQWVLFNGNGNRGFFCAEPQLGPVNALNSGGYHRLAPGSSETFRTLIFRLPEPV